MTNPFLRLARWLREHRLVQVFVLYFAACWVILQVVAVFISNFGLPRWFFPAAVLLLVIGFVVMTATAMAQRAASQPAPPVVEPIAESLRAGRLPTLTWRRAVLGGVLAFSLWGAAAGVFVLLRGTKDEPGPDLGAAGPAVAVLPFRTVGAGLELWREGMVDLLSTNLDEAGALRAIDARAVLRRWRDRIGEGKEAADSRAALDVAKDLNATFAVMGSVVALGDRVRLQAELYEPTGRRRAQAQTEGPQDSVFGLVDKITVDLLSGALETRPLSEVHLAAVTTSSLPALKAYLRGEQVFRRARWEEAITEYSQAVSLDSTFAMAYWRMASAYGWIANFEQTARVSAIAARYADRLPERQRLKLHADRALSVGRISGLEMFRALTSRYPDDVDAWYNLGEAITHFGFLANLPQHASLDAFSRAVTLDSTFTQALIHPFSFYLARGDSVEARRYFALSLAIDSASPLSVGFRIAYNLVYGSPADSAEAIAALDTASAEAIGQAELALNGVPAGDLTLRVARAAAAPRHPAAVRARAHVFYAHWWYVWRGRAREALQEIEAAEALEPLLRLAPIYIHDYLTGYGDSARAARAASALQAQREPLARWFLGALALRWGRYLEVESQLGALRQRADSARAEGDSTGAEIALGLQQGLEGFVLLSRGDAGRAADNLAQSVPLMSGFGDYYMLGLVTLYHRFTLAEVLEELGKESEALEIFRVFSENQWYPHFTVPAALAAARIEERRGERERAIVHYAHVVKMWEEADPQFQSRVEEARRGLQRLAGERASR